jgi:hypothetical protein
MCQLLPTHVSLAVLAFHRKGPAHGSKATLEVREARCRELDKLDGSALNLTADLGGERIDGFLEAGSCRLPRRIIGRVHLPQSLDAVSHPAKLRIECVAKRECSKPVDRLLPIDDVGGLVDIGGGFPPSPIGVQPCSLLRKRRGDICSRIAE